jgi:hypothetical protein
VLQRQQQQQQQQQAKESLHSDSINGGSSMAGSMEVIATAGSTATASAAHRKCGSYGSKGSMQWQQKRWHHRGSSMVLHRAAVVAVCGAVSLHTAVNACCHVTADSLLVSQHICAPVGCSQQRCLIQL